LATPATRGWRALFAAAALGVCWLAFSPHPPPAADTGWDKLNHLSAFVVLSVFGERSFALRSGWRAAVPLALLAFGVFIELVQSQIPGRSADAADVLADALGIAAGLLIAAAWRRLG
jgi:VanZ family protein